jgi:hypothetical protein
MKEEFLKLKIEYDKNIKQPKNINTYNVNIFENNYKGKQIISKCILIKNRELDENNVFYRTLVNIFHEITDFYNNQINLSTEEECDDYIKKISNDILS